MRHNRGDEKRYRTGGIRQAFSKALFDVGIAEGHAVTFSAGLAATRQSRYLRLFNLLQRSYDQILNDAAIAGEHIVLAVDRAG